MWIITEKVRFRIYESTNECNVWRSKRAIPKKPKKTNDKRGEVK